MPKKIQITADDFGVHKTIDNGIKDCVAVGMVDCVAMIVTHHSASRRIRSFIKEFEPQIESGDVALGLHLSLSCGSPQYTKDYQYLKAISKRQKFNGRRIFKHKGALGLITNMDKLLKHHEDALEQEMIEQYNRFVKITGLEPKHLSSHLGIYNGNQKLYNMYSRFCKEKGMQMRCPTFICFEHGKHMWRSDPDQKMLPAGLLKHLGSDFKSILKWIKKKVGPQFRDDVKDGLLSTDYFIEHFYKQGSLRNFQKIIDKLEDDEVYEMVVHPVKFQYDYEYKSLPPGIKKQGFALRSDEYITLVTPGAQEYLDSNGVERYKI